MRASTSRVIFCIGLFSLTACAVLPVPAVSPVAAVTAASPMKVEVRLRHPDWDAATYVMFDAEEAAKKLPENSKVGQAMKAKVADLTNVYESSKDKQKELEDAVKKLEEGRK